MSDYQYIYFSAVDEPLDDKQLEYMRHQSTRAEATRWQSTNEYHYGDFHGNSLEMMRRVLEDDAAAVRAESLAAMRNKSDQSTWPANPGSRTLEELRELASVKADQRKKRELTSEKRKLERRIAKMRKHPAAATSDAEKLIQSRSTENYTKAAKMLAELREAVGGDEGSRMADQAARRIAKKYPTLSYAKRAFKEQGLNYR
ncbi:hypothetical protein [Allorhodopirellula heiligendammensis]|uniref:Uncharacterized protein n=1 Tax=Allorhodopirellula heiligendammensis TaxID=2714739 RepID=A0A5C6C4E4_9BACT|nr:hypothetical protein [Allorhodopirellula heiligendammensis]TWU18857.1 hypothetical protein Poly21_10240 [Allorhodopirellula heiligendammensis]